jgi:RNA methyltransferase, TrmH family
MKEISSIHHPLVRYWQQLKSDGRFRRSENSVLLEGRNAIDDVCARITAKRIITRSFDLVTPTLLTDEVIIVSEQILKKISSVEQSDGLIAELPLPPRAI